MSTCAKSGAYSTAVLRLLLAALCCYPHAPTTIQILAALSTAHCRRTPRRWEAKQLPDVLHAAQLPPHAVTAAVSPLGCAAEPVLSPPDDDYPQPSDAAVPQSLRPHPTWAEAVHRDFVRHRQYLRWAASQVRPRPTERALPTGRAGWAALLWPASTTDANHAGHGHQRNAAAAGAPTPSIPTPTPTVSRITRLAPRQLAGSLSTVVSLVAGRAKVEGGADDGSQRTRWLLSPHSCAWIFGLLAWCDSVLALEASLGSDLRLLMKVVLWERAKMRGASPMESAVDAAGTSAVAEPAAEQDQITRVDPADGLEYTLQEFIDQYGGTDEWDRAQPLARGVGREPLEASASGDPAALAAVNVLLVVLSRFFRVGGDLEHLI
jgi:hypothetical protein